jgi:hypothetical protein
LDPAIIVQKGTKIIFLLCVEGLKWIEAARGAVRKTGRADAPGSRKAMRCAYDSSSSFGKDADIVSIKREGAKIGSVVLTVTDANYRADLLRIVGDMAEGDLTADNSKTISSSLTEITAKIHDGSSIAAESSRLIGDLDAGMADFKTEEAPLAYPGSPSGESITWGRS